MFKRSLAAACFTALAAATLAGTASADPLPYGPDTCISGYVWREAFPGDVVCVTPEIRTLVQQENALAASRRVVP